MTIKEQQLRDRLAKVGARREAALVEREASAKELAKAVNTAAKSGMSKADIARAAGVSRQTVHTALRGQS